MEITQEMWGAMEKRVADLEGYIRSQRVKFTHQEVEQALNQAFRACIDNPSDLVLPSDLRLLK